MSEVFCKGDTSEFPSSMWSSHVPHLVVKRSEAMKLLSRLVEVGASDPQVALILL